MINNNNTNTARKWKESDANILSLLSFFWLYDLIKKGQSQMLTAADIDELPRKHTAQYLLGRFKSKWNETDNPSLLYILLLVISPFKLFICFTSYFAYRFSLMFIVIYFRLIMQYFDECDKGKHTNLSINEAYTYCVILSVLLFVRPFIEHHGRYKVHTELIHVRSVLTAMIFDKVLKISSSAYDTAHILNILTDDVQKIEPFFEKFIETCAYLVDFLCLFYLANVVKNWFYLTGLLALFVFLVIIAITAPINTGYKKHILFYSDQRLKFLKEAIIGYLNTKMYQWEASIQTLIENTRYNELKYLMLKGNLAACHLAVFTMSDTVILFVVIVSCFYSQSVLELTDIYPILLLYTLLGYSVVGFSETAIAYSQLKISIPRIVGLLQCENIHHYNPQSDHFDSPRIDLSSATFYWKSNNGLKNVALYDISINIEKNALYGIIGKVGSGKSALLLAIIGELKPLINDDVEKLKLLMNDDDEQFNCCVSGKIGYCSQVPWILNASVKENILCGNVYDEEWYKNVIYCCSLHQDFCALPHSDATIIGARGINLSGGQKARIGLARCVYDQPDILLLDDILSACDSIVAKHIFEHVIHNKSGLMKDTLRLLVTHQINILPLMDKLIIMDNGRISHIDSYSNLIQMECNNISPLLQLHSESQSISALNTHKKASFYNISGDKSKNKHLASQQSVVKDEISQSGAVSFSIYLRLFSPSTSKCMQWWTFLTICTLMFITQLIHVASQYWVGIWAQLPTNKQADISNVIVYTLMVIVGIIINITTKLYLFRTVLCGSSKLHNKMLSGVLKSSMKFYESNPAGRILNRFSQDQLNVDERLPATITYSIYGVMNFSMIFILLALTNITSYSFLVLITILCYLMTKLYLNVSRSLTRLVATTKSPIYSYFTAYYAGVCTIRAFKKQNYILKNAFSLIDINAAVNLIYFACQKWIALVLDLALTLCICVVLFSSIYSSTTASSNGSNVAVSVGISFVYFLFSSLALSWTVRTFAETENFMVSTERIVEYCNLPKEGEEIENDPSLIIQPQIQWPQTGTIKFVNLSVAYRTYFDPVLHDINISISDKEKIGIVGRTGSGKSTIFKSIFRLLPFREGYIEIDGINICNISLHTLRKCLFIIPQNCLLFSSTLRYNLDPFDEYEDEQLLGILNEVQLNVNNLNNINGLCLDSVMSEYGSNLSVGQCQLICVARALLNYKKNKILLIDEATANIDPHTEKIIQILLEHKLFQNKTVLTIAHRIKTVINYDKILVLDKGRVVEFDTPQNLLNNTKSTFYQMHHQQNT